ASCARDYGGRGPHVALLPGSRKQEVKLILPVMAKAADILEKKNPGAGFIIAAASREAAGWIEQILSSMGMTGRFTVVAGKTRQILRQADAAWVASGTATIEAALMGCPIVVVYRVRRLTYLAGRILIRVPFLGMVNIVAGKQICPEFIQPAATPENLARAIEPLVVEGKARNEMISELDRVRSILGSPGAEERAADILLQELK
ncbi:MAG: lipid-A-disaccharide synthase, partial [Kiritimatiellia bacterium]|nr:lipid-A-disaccharide synthase [Kiritimatiellia bacterium]